MKDPKALNEDTFEKIRPKRKHGPHVRKRLRGKLTYCNGKHQYHRETVAVVLKRQLAAGVPYLRSYRCPTCFFWHLTHKKPNARR